ncbi:MAG TPA: CoA pyrophosphatase [Candidatus Marinimicrobia bacterium]|nr:CoA pyrophosphatase [Candidatus Neomarinimicrobiota bacterium]
MKKILADFQTLIQKLSNALEQPLPGIEAQMRMLPEGRLPAAPASNYIDAATLICLYISDDTIFFPVIRRANHPKDRHRQQISFPGGKREKGETLRETALREAFEELGIYPDDVIILGRLTSLPIPVSGFIMHPFLAYCKKMPAFHIDPDEVQSVHLISINDLISKDTIKVKEWILGNKKRQVPVFQINELRIWGATAMVLSEFAAILSKLLIEADE